MRTIDSWSIPRRATDRLSEADAMLIAPRRLKETDALFIACLRGVVYGTSPRPFKRSEFGGAIALVFLVVAAIIIAAGLGR